MGKKVFRIRQDAAISSGAALSRIKKALGDKCACCVLITCSEPSSAGNMEVEMSFEGEESLAAFLIDNAAQVFDEKISKRESK